LSKYKELERERGKQRQHNEKLKAALHHTYYHNAITTTTSTTTI
jgi:hypothetical protein